MKGELDLAIKRVSKSEEVINSLYLKLDEKVELVLR